MFTPRSVFRGNLLVVQDDKASKVLAMVMDYVRSTNLWTFVEAVWELRPEPVYRNRHSRLAFITVDRRSSSEHRHIRNLLPRYFVKMFYRYIDILCE